MLLGTRTILMRSKRWKAESVPLRPPPLMTKGIESASRYKACRLSGWSATGILRTSCTSHGARTASTKPPATPNASVMNSEVQNRPGISCRSLDAAEPEVEQAKVADHRRGKSEHAVAIHSERVNNDRQRHQRN